MWVASDANQRENDQLRQQLATQWAVLYDAMLLSNEQAAEVVRLREENRVLREQNERLLSNERQAFRCLADNERKTKSYRKRNRALVRRNKDLLQGRRQLYQSVAALQDRLQASDQQQQQAKERVNSVLDSADLASIDSSGATIDSVMEEKVVGSQKAVACGVQRGVDL